MSEYANAGPVMARRPDPGKREEILSREHLGRAWVQPVTHEHERGARFLSAGVPRLPDYQQPTFRTGVCGAGTGAGVEAVEEVAQLRADAAHWR